jgi:hypothetical protein
VIGAGSDAGSLWLQVPLALSLALVIALLGQRIAMSAGRRRVERPQLPAPAPAVSPAPAPLWLHGDPERRHA